LSNAIATMQIYKEILQYINNITHIHECQAGI